MTLRILLFVALAAAAVTPTTAQQGAPVKAFTGMRLVDGTDRAPVDNATILVRDGRVAAAGPAASVTIPAGAERVSLSGKHVIPGLINAHGHANNVDKDLDTYAKYGVTTVFSLGNDGNAPAALAARDAQASSSLSRARIYTSGPVINPATAEAARADVAKIAAMKVDNIKIRVDDNLGTTAKMAPEVYRAVIDESHKRGLRVMVHLFYLSDAKGVLDAGADLIAHSVRDLEVDSDLINKMKGRGICLSPTLMREVSTYVYESTPAFFSDPLFVKYSDPQWISQRKDPAFQAKTAKDPSGQRYKAALEVASRNMKKLADAGVPIAMGTDTGPAGRFMGYFELMELELMAKAGMTPKQVLLSATRDAARCHKVEADLGTLEAKRWADFVVLNADPLANVSNVRQIADVYIAGNKVAR
jgi:imidazolonepropionase-like amidohydrolase